MIIIRGHKWTNQDIENFVSQSECKLISIEKENGVNIVNLICKCGNLFRTRFSNFKNNGKKQCNDCGKKIKINKIKTDFSKVKECFEKEGYKLLSTEYKNDKQLLDTICPKGHKYTVRYNKFKAGDRCAICAGNYKDTQIYKEQIKKIRNGEFEVLEEYQKANIEIKHRHKICGKEFYAKPCNFISKPGCPICDKYRRWDNELIKEKIFKMYNGEYKLLEDFKTVGQHHLFLHESCGNKYYTTITNFLRGSRCPFCFGNIKKTTNQYKEEIEKITNYEYTIIQEYINNKIKIMHKHLVCGNEFLMAPSVFLYQEQRCPKCKPQSKGQNKIAKWLEENNINYISEYRFDDCKNDNTNYYLYFDFAVFKDGKLYSLIEFDGRQHFEWVKNMMTYEDFLNLQYRDNLKNQYCKQNNIPLLRINYKQLRKIDNILSEYFSASIC